AGTQAGVTVRLAAELHDIAVYGTRIGGAEVVPRPRRATPVGHRDILALVGVGTGATRVIRFPGVPAGIETAAVDEGATACHVRALGEHATRDGALVASYR